jgi:hypothetical protein
MCMNILETLYVQANKCGKVLGPIGTRDSRHETLLFTSLYSPFFLTFFDHFFLISSQTPILPLPPITLLPLYIGVITPYSEQVAEIKRRLVTSGLVSLPSSESEAKHTTSFLDVEVRFIWFVGDME